MLYAFGSRACFMMPERMAKTPASEQIKESVGSGPFRFLTERMGVRRQSSLGEIRQLCPPPGTAAVFLRRQGGEFRSCRMDRPARSSHCRGALQTGEVDWVEVPLIDLLPMLKRADGVEVKIFDSFWLARVLAFNHLYPPFDNPKLLRALLPAVDQKAYVQAIVGEQTDLGRIRWVSSPMAHRWRTRRARRCFPARATSPWRKAGGRIRLQGRADPADVADGSADYRAIDAGDAQPVPGPRAECRASRRWIRLAVSRRANTAPPDKGGWNSFCSCGAG